jgi:uncharacterized membrane protein YhdT
MMTLLYLVVWVTDLRPRAWRGVPGMFGWFGHPEARFDI